MVHGTVTSRTQVFLLVWCGQLVSRVGSGLTAFALGVWVYQRTGSATLFTLMAICTTLPDLLLSPLAGALVDRWDRRWAMILSDAGAGLCTLGIVLLLMLERLEIWHLYLIMALSSACKSFQLPAYLASLTLLVPKRHYGRASGMMQIEQAASHAFAPILGAFLLVTIHLH